MASDSAKSSKAMRRLESKKSHSWWWDSHISPKNSRWLQENLEKMDQNIKRMLKLVEEDGDSFAKKAEMYYQKRPELINLVEEFYRMYRSLAERYDNVTGELRKSIPSDLQSQGSGISGVGSEPSSTWPSPDLRPTRQKSGPRAAGFEFFLGGGHSSDFNKEGDESSTLDSESESDDSSSINNYSTTLSNDDDHGLRRRIFELESELREVKGKLLLQQQEISEGSFRGSQNGNHETLLARVEEELRIANERILLSEEEIVRLRIELQKYESGFYSPNDGDSLAVEAKELPEHHEITEPEAEILDPEFKKIQALEEELRITKEKLHDSEEEVKSLRRELKSNESSIKQLQDQLGSKQKDASAWTAKLDKEKREVSRLQDRILRYKNNLSERDQEIRGLKESISNANKALSEENSQLQEEITKLLKERAYLQDNVKEMDVRCQCLEEEARRVLAGKSEMEALLGSEIEQFLGAPYRGGNAVVVNNSLLISPVGNRVSVTDLVKSETVTLPCQSSSNLRRIAASPDGVFLLAIDENNRCLFINLRRRTVLHRITFKHPVATAKFSPDGNFIAVAAGKLLQIWRSPGFRKEFFPFELIRTFADCNDRITSLDWSPDSDYILAGSKDLTVRLFCCSKSNKFNKPFLFLGHRDAIVGCFFGVDKKTNKVSSVYTVSRDGAIFSWGYSETDEKFDEMDRDVSEPESPGTPEQRQAQNEGVDYDSNAKKRKNFDGKDKNLGEEKGPWLHRLKWELLKKDYFMQTPAKLTACDYHRGLDMVVVGFSNGVFGLYQMPDFVCIHLLSISREKITTSVFNDLGNWLTFGCAKLGQLLVWEWKSESYILKQQGHYFDVNCLAYSPDSQLLATGADDNKIKVWTVSSGFCFVTFSEHSNAVTALHFMPNNHCLLSASLDGTVRAWDLFRYRNFRTFTTPTSKQFVSLASDQSGEVICAGTLDSFEIYVWSMKTGRLLDVLSGHEGPVHGLVFSPTNAVLASSSWDKTVRLWDVFDGKGAVETFPHTHDVLTVVYRPDGKQLACSTLDGQIHFWDPIEGLLMYTIEGRRDIAGGRLMTDRRSAANSTSGKCFTTLNYSADGSYILAGGNSKYICMYDIADQVLLRRFQITHNLSLDGVLDFLNSKNMTEAGPLDLIDDDNSDTEEGVDRQSRKKLAYDLPGSMPNHGRPVIRTKCLRIAPTGRSWAAATTEGVLIYSMDESFIFDPTDLDIDVTPDAVNVALSEGQTKRALILSLRLNEDSLIKKCIVAVSPADIPAAASSIPFKYLQRLVTAFADLLENCPHLEFILRWCQELCKAHGQSIQQNSRNLLPALKSLQKAITRLHQDLADTCSSNEYLLRYLCSASNNR